MRWETTEVADAAHRIFIPYEFDDSNSLVTPVKCRNGTHHVIRGGFSFSVLMTVCAYSGRQIRRSGIYGFFLLYKQADPSIRDACSPAARATATGAQLSHSY